MDLALQPGAAVRPEPLLSSDAQALLGALPGVALVVHRGGRVAAANAGPADLLGRAPLDLLGRDLFVELAEGPRLRAALDEALAAAAPRELVLSAGTLRARLWPLALSGEGYALLLVEDDRRLLLATQSLAAAQAEAREGALRDPLTGLYTRAHLGGVLVVELGRAQRYNYPLSLCVLAIDDLRGLGRRSGRALFDRALRDAAAAIGRTLRASDPLFRTGDDELCALLPHTGREEALCAAERLHEAVAALRFERDPALRLTISVGVTTAPQPVPRSRFEEQGEELLAKAGACLQRAQEAGGARTLRVPL